MTGSPARLRVAFVLGSASGGIARHVGALACGCQVAGAAVMLLGPAPALALLPAGIDRVPIPIGERPRPVLDAVAILRLRAALVAVRPEVVHAHGVRAGAFAALAIAGRRSARTPRRPALGRPALGRPALRRPALVVTVHNAPPAGRLASLVYRLLEIICARRADVVLCASADLLDRMRARGAAAAAQSDVPAPPTAEPSAAEVAAVRAGLSPSGRPIVLAVARLAPQKGLDVLVDAAGRWRDKEPRPQTVIAGSGPLAAELSLRAHRHGADVALLGARDDVPALLAAADVVVVPSRWEARSLVIQEALRLGRPIVATRVGGTPELTGPDAALLIPAEDAAALADAVLAVLGHPLLAERLGVAARRRGAALGSQRDAVDAMLARYARLTASQPAAGARSSWPKSLGNNRRQPPD